MSGGEGDYLYQYNYGNIASDPRLAAMNFIHALATIEPTLEKFRKKNEELEKDIPSCGKWWKVPGAREPELTALKTDLTEIDRRIQQSLKPIEESEGKEAEEDNDVCRERHDTAEELPKEDNTAAVFLPGCGRLPTPPGAHRDRGRGQPAGERPRKERDQDKRKADGSTDFHRLFSYVRERCRHTSCKSVCSSSCVGR